MSSIQIIVLALEHGCYYVEATNSPAERFVEHLNGKGCKWTRTHKPLRIERVIPDSHIGIVHEIVLEYMSAVDKGIDKVRGGLYRREELTFAQKYMLQPKIWQAQGRCTKCGRRGHPMKYCTHSFDVHGRRIGYAESTYAEWRCLTCKKGFTNEWESEVHMRECRKTIPKCFHCKELGHYAHQCALAEILR